MHGAEHVKLACEYYGGASCNATWLCKIFCLLSSSLISALAYGPDGSALELVKNLQSCSVFLLALHCSVGICEKKRSFLLF
jgi:hypothetical protein